MEEASFGDLTTKYESTQYPIKDSCNDTVFKKPLTPKPKDRKKSTKKPSKPIKREREDDTEEIINTCVTELNISTNTIGDGELDTISDIRPLTLRNTRSRIVGFESIPTRPESDTYDTEKLLKDDLKLPDILEDETTEEETMSRSEYNNGQPTFIEAPTEYHTYQEKQTCAQFDQIEQDTEEMMSESQTMSQTTNYISTQISQSKMSNDQLTEKVSKAESTKTDKNDKCKTKSKSKDKDKCITENYNERLNLSKYERAFKYNSLYERETEAHKSIRTRGQKFEMTEKCFSKLNTTQSVHIAYRLFSHLQRVLKLSGRLDETISFCLIRTLRGQVNLIINIFECHHPNLNFVNLIIWLHLSDILLEKVDATADKKRKSHIKKPQKFLIKAQKILITRITEYLTILPKTSIFTRSNRTVFNTFVDACNSADALLINNISANLLPKKIKEDFLKFAYNCVCNTLITASEICLDSSDGQANLAIDLMNFIKSVLNLVIQLLPGCSQNIILLFIQFFYLSEFIQREFSDIFINFTVNITMIPDLPKEVVEVLTKKMVSVADKSDIEVISAIVEHGF